MVREAANAESAMDFIHKLAIAQKEIGETEYWLEVLYKSEIISLNEFESLNNSALEIMKIIRSSILTKKRNIVKKVVPVILIIGSLLSYIML